jgi:NtrC-family two-component system response regulator AlgB
MAGMTASNLRVLVIDDERNIRTALAFCLEGMGASVTQAATGEAALAALAAQPADIAFLDLRLGHEGGLDLLPQLFAAQPGLAVILITAYATIETAVEALKRGARDYLPKPFAPTQIRQVVDKVLECRALSGKVEQIERQLVEAVPEAELATQSPRMQSTVELALRAAAAEAPVLLRGESGTGKGVLARAIHAHSPRSARPFVTVNCPTLSEDLLASELFGHAKGAFTGAVRDQPGRVEMAEGGTLFLDELGEISPAVQAKLLRFLQEKRFERMGENRTRTADVRLLAATNRDVEEDVAKGRFREDLLYRLNVVEVTLPPLRERPEDLLRLARHFLALFAKEAKRQVPELSREAEHALLSYAWPGNVRELRNVMERATILWPAQRIEPEAFPDRISHREAGPRLGGDHTVEEIERAHILRVMGRTATLEEAARILAVDASTLWRKRKKYEER